MLGFLKRKLLNWLRLTDQPAIKIYNGFGDSKNVTVFGHVFALGPKPKKHYTSNVFTNTFALIRLFVVKTIPGIEVYVEVNGREVKTRSEKDGFFRIQWQVDEMPAAGWHAVTVRSRDSYEGQPIAEGHGHFHVPFTRYYTVISDIDDTFLVSHSSNMRKRLFVLLTENARSRQPFDGVVKHYRLLAHAGSKPEEPNPFFYVSSSEWNLYDYISEFSKEHELPRGIYLLSQIKKFSEAYKTGQNKHATKFMRIARIIEAYPQQKFILLGDDSQQDPVIYRSITEHFPGKIRAVYLRHVYRKNVQVAKDSIKAIQDAGISCCHFVHSRDAIEHSIREGIVTAEQTSMMEK
jgi:phosphatidate phosphatase APP1